MSRRSFDHDAHMREQMAIMEFNDNMLDWLNKWTPTICGVWLFFLTIIFLKCVIYGKKELSPEKMEKRRREHEMLLRIELDMQRKKAEKRRETEKKNPRRRRRRGESPAQESEEEEENVCIVEIYYVHSDFNVINLV